MTELAIRWQRLVDEDGRTCERCGATGEALDGAVRRLARALGELGIRTVLETHTLDPAVFGENPLESNRIWLAGRPLEDWLAATVGRSACCSACGDSECRTVTVDGTTYEAIAPELILEAGLLAAAHVLRDRRVSGSGGGAGCCSPDDPPSGC